MPNNEERITTVAYPEAQEGEKQIDLKEFEINKLKENLANLERRYAKLAKTTSLYRDTLISICKEIGGDI
jgi:hypothetical protein